MALNTNLVKHYEWHYLASAVISVVRENQKAAVAAAEADSDDWTRCSELRHGLVKRARVVWSLLTEKGPHQFPWSEDAVCEWYMKCRKRSDAELDAYEVDLRRMRDGVSGGSPALFAIKR